jgi:hypothetical protein
MLSSRVRFLHAIFVETSRKLSTKNIKDLQKNKRISNIANINKGDELFITVLQQHGGSKK